MAPVVHPPIAVITGGGRGLGRSAALHLARAGTDIILTYQSQVEAAEQVASDIRALGRRAQALRLDVGQSGTFAAFADQVRTTLQSWGAERIHALVNNAGIGTHAAFQDTTEAQFDQLMNVHLKGTFFLTQRLLPLMADGGRIINLSSGLARFTLPGYAAYAAMKGGVEVLTRYLAKELGPRRITVNTLAPGAIETDFGGGAVRDNAAINQVIASQTALGRVGLPDDIGGALEVLLSEGAHWINGQRIEASGGMFL
jgi:NAD(P)-dependent dehydrogenase (short-subunit alcohol dehydrogenase family)